MQGLRSGISKPPVQEQRLINRLHAEKMKRWKDAAEAKVERKRKRKAEHDKARKLARAEGKPRPATRRRRRPRMPRTTVWGTIGRRRA